MRLDLYGKKWVCLLLIVALLLNMMGCGNLTKGPNGGGAIVAQAEDLMEGITAAKVNGKEIDDRFISSTADFAVKLFQNRMLAENEKEGENILISPLSVLLALAMTANGADGETLTGMEGLLGGGMPINELNQYLYTYANSLPNEELAKLNIANSIWIRETVAAEVREDFLQTNADYYGAAARRAAFDDQTKKEINSWVEENTDGLIKEIISDDIPQETVMYLINAIVFDARWRYVYAIEDISEGTFTGANGTVQDVSMMRSEEDQYLNDGQATGFIKPYAGDYSFAALLPNEGVDINEYMASLTGETLIETLSNADRNGTVIARMPKFSYEDTTLMNEELKALGMEAAFTPGQADFSGMMVMGKEIYIGQVLHKTFIAVDELGTKAGAVTAVRMDCESAPANIYQVTLDRPFVYVIFDNATKLPIFIGAVMDISE